MRLVDADALLAELHQYDDDCAFKDEFEYGLQQRLDTCIYAVEDAPTVDAVPMVRCKDCRWRTDKSGSTAWMPCRALVTPDNFSCVIGERKEGGDNG